MFGCTEDGGKRMEKQDLIICDRTIPAREGRYVPFPAGLNRDIAEYLISRGIEKLYCHQAEMFEEASEGKNVVITTPTASGKTLAFLLPVLQEILADPLTRAVFIYPTKALAGDQYRAMKPWIDYFGEGRIAAGVYDGDTPASERSRIRRGANIILTNPEMLNGSFLPNHSKYGFDFIFSHLKFVVIDELHTYRGAFGSHLANVFRRLSRICRYYHSMPQFLCSSATIANPVELAEGICGRSFVKVDEDGSPASARRYMLVQPPKIMGSDKNYYGQVQAVTVAAEMLPGLVEADRSFIAFAKSRRTVEIVLKEARDRLEAAGFLGRSESDRISGYRGGYTSQERKEIESRMISGSLCGLVSTNALELGIDIGKIDTTVLIGYPGTRASFWQQTGRAGRNLRECTNYLILDNLPFDQYIALEPGWLFDGSSENAVIDKNNLLIELAHIRAAAAEIPLTLDDISLFPDLGEAIPVLLGAGELAGQGGKFAWSGGEYPAGDYSLRNIDKSRYKLLNQENSRVITEMDEMQAFRELHDGAVYMHDGDSYQIVRLELETKTAFALPFNGNYYTVPGGETNIQVIHSDRQQELGRVEIQFGDVNVNDYIYMYKKLQFHNHQNLGFTQLERPLAKEYDTESTWIRLPADVTRTFRSYLQKGPDGQSVRNDHFEGLCFALQNSARMVTMTEQDDIGVTTSNLSTELAEYFSDSVFVYIYDKYVGGLGFSEKIYELMEEVISNAVKMVGGCKCQDGCAACVGDYRLDKGLILWGLKSLLIEADPPKGIKKAAFSPSTFTAKKFKFSELPDRWGEFCSYVKENGDPFAAFLNSVPRAAVDGSRLVLFMDGIFFREWVQEENNQRALKNIISYYTEAPAGLTVSVRAEESGADAEGRKEKLRRRYDNLKNKGTE